MVCWTVNVQLQGQRFKLKALCLCDITYSVYMYRTVTLSTMLVESIISSIRINRITTRSRWKFTICTTSIDLTLYSFSSLYIFVTWGWPTVAETCRQPNKTDTKTVVFWLTYTLLICIKHSWDDAAKETASCSVRNLLCVFSWWVGWWVSESVISLRSTWWWHMAVLWGTSSGSINAMNCSSFCKFFVIARKQFIQGCW